MRSALGLLVVLVDPRILNQSTDRIGQTFLKIHCGLLKKSWGADRECSTVQHPKVMANLARANLALYALIANCPLQYRPPFLLRPIYGPIPCLTPDPSDKFLSEPIAHAVITRLYFPSAPLLCTRIEINLLHDRGTTVSGRQSGAVVAGGTDR